MNNFWRSSVLALSVIFVTTARAEDSKSAFTIKVDQQRLGATIADFAQGLYRQYHNGVSGIAPKESTDKSAMIAFAIEPRDTSIEAAGFAKVPEEEPASQALFPVLTAIDAARTLQNEKDVVVALGLAPEVVTRLKEVYEKQGEIESNLETPYIQIAEFAFKNGIKVVGIDPLAKDQRYLAQSDVSEPRYQAMRDAVSNITNGNTGQIVIAVVDDFVLSNLMGVSNTQAMRLAVDPKNTVAIPEKSKQPLTPHFSEIVYVNTSYDGRLEAGVIHGQNLDVLKRLREGGGVSIKETGFLAIQGEGRFITNPDNAVQANVPDSVEKTSADKIVKAVEAASIDFHTPPVPEGFKQDGPQP